jgi:hypothetical protein
MEDAHIWQKRFYDFVVLSEKKKLEKLRYIHRNPVREIGGEVTASVVTLGAMATPIRGTHPSKIAKVGQPAENSLPRLCRVRASAGSFDFAQDDRIGVAKSGCGGRLVQLGVNAPRSLELRRQTRGLPTPELIRKRINCLRSG